MSNHPSHKKTTPIHVSFVKDGHSTAPRLLVRRNDQQAGILDYNGRAWIFRMAGAPQPDGFAKLGGTTISWTTYTNSVTAAWMLLEGASYTTLNDALQVLVQAEPRALKRDTKSEANYLLQRFANANNAKIR